MDNRNDPRNSAYRSHQPNANQWRWTGARGAKWRMPVPPGPPPEPSKAEREEEARAAARAEARVARLHLAGLLSGGTLVMFLVLVAVIFMLVLVLVLHR
jgi:hypothetical protein